MTVTPEQAVDAANATFGSHPGYRALHAKGTLLSGAFVAAPEAAALTRAAHMQGDSVPVTARVSNGAGHPKQPDYVPDVRGLAVKFELPDGSATDIVAQTSPRFVGPTPDDFVALVRALKPPALAWRLPLFLAQNPGRALILGQAFPTTMPPTSYATCRYYPIHAFGFITADGTTRYVRYTWIPEREEPRLKPWTAKRRGEDFLAREIRERVARGPVRFTLELQLAEPGDDMNDPSSVWPAARRRVNAGTLELTALTPDPDRLRVFDPMQLTDGIEPTDDPVLRFRPQAYAVSVQRREASGAPAP